MKKKLIGAICAGLLFVPCMGLAGCNHEHKYATTWTNDTTHHWHACTTCGEADEKHEHNWDEGTVTVQPTSTITGTELFVCQDCNMSKTEVIPKISTVVTADEWETALGLRQIDKYQITKVEAAEYPDVVQKDGDIVYFVDGTEQTYIALECGEYAEYYREDEDHEWYRYDHPTYSFNNVVGYDMVDDAYRDKYTEFTYDPTTQEYVCQTTMSGSIPAILTTRLSFLDGKLVKFVADAEYQGEAVGYCELLFTYDDISLNITLPQSYWDYKLGAEITGYYNVYQFKIDAIGFEENWETDDIYQVKTGMEIYYDSMAKLKYWRIKGTNNEWNVESFEGQTRQFSSFQMFAAELKELYSEFEYDYTTRTSTATNVEIQGTTYDSIKVTFGGDADRISGITFTKNGVDLVGTITYNLVHVNIPTVE